MRHRIIKKILADRDTMNATINFKEKYKKEIVPAMMKKFGLSNIFAVPCLKKIVLNIGTGRYREEQQMNAIKKYLSMIVGQTISPRPAKKSIATFKTREGMTIGYRATLHGNRMYDFLQRMILVAIPRTRDFHGISTASIDQENNLTIGFREHIVFPEMINEDIKMIFGFEVTLVTSAKTREEALELFTLLGIPFKK